MSQPLFPTVLWGACRATFLPLGMVPPADAPVHAALVFAMQKGKFVVADIARRGWCIPSGRLEPGETPEEAVRREAQEEAGATLGELRLLGHYVLTDTHTGAITLAPAYLAEALRLDPLPPQTESQGVRLLALDELPRHYFTWDALIEAVFAYVWAQTNSPRP